MTTEDIHTFNPADSTQPVWFRIGNTGHRPLEPWDSVMPADTGFYTLPSREKSFFTGRKAGSPLPQSDRKEVEKDWLYGSFAMLLIMILLLRILYARQINEMFRVFFYPGLAQPEGRVFDLRFNLFSILFILIYSTTFGLLLLSALEGYQWIPALHAELAVPLFFLFSLAFALLLLIKVALIRLSGSIFSTLKHGLAYQDHLMVSAFTTSALIIPLVVVNAFSTSGIFLPVTFVIISITLIIRIYRTMIVGFNEGTFSGFHFILYFCTLEILPLLIIGKIVLQFLMK